MYSTSTFSYLSLWLINLLIMGGAGGGVGEKFGQFGSA